MVQGCCWIVVSLSMNCLVMLLLGFQVLQGRCLAYPFDIDSAYFCWWSTDGLEMALFLHFWQIASLAGHACSDLGCVQVIYHIYHISLLCWICWSQFVVFLRLWSAPDASFMQCIDVVHWWELQISLLLLTAVYCFFTTFDWRTVLTASSKVKFY